MHQMSACGRLLPDAPPSQSHDFRWSGAVRLAGQVGRDFATASAVAHWIPLQERIDGAADRFAAGHALR